MKNKEQQEHYLQHGHLINKKIQCNQCETDVTMFGSNLENRINKFGTLWSLLDEFKCRKCVSASKPKKEKVVSVRFMKRVEKEEKKKLDIPKMKFSVPRNVFLKDAPDIIESVTQFSCAAPALFLNNGKNCDGCAFWNNCQCPIKTSNEFATA